MADYLAIDADGHTYETPEMWSKYMEEPYKSRAPRLVRDSWGHERYMIEGRIGPIDAYMLRNFGDISEMAATRKGGWDPKARLEDMDREGVESAILFASIAATALVVEDLGYGAAMCRAYNNWLADYCSENPKRLLGVTVVPFQDVDEAIKEMKRGKELGFLTVEIPPSCNGKELDDPYYEPFWAEAERLSIGVCVHETMQVLSEIPMGERHRDMFPLLHAGTFVMNYMLALGRLIYGGVLDRHPKIRIAFLESGATWLPYWIERLDKYAVNMSDALPDLKKAPHEYICEGDQLYFALEPDEKLFREVVDIVGEDRLMYASDYPHWDAERGAVKEIHEIKEFSESRKRKLLRDNVSRFLGL
jgi:predicted TIM-barrel fold metal-dependent hydrolase